LERTQRLSLSDRKKMREELLAFQALASLIDLRVDHATIVQAPPPAPDIECEVDGLGPLAVELTALDANPTRQRLSNWQSTRLSWTRALMKWSPEQRKLIRQHGADLSLSLDIANEANLRDRISIMAAIQATLLESPDLEGKLFESGQVPKGLERGVAYRGGLHAKGPHIISFSAGSWRPPLLSKIVDKLTRKNYKTDSPLELFAYSTHDEPTGAVGLREQIEKCIAEHLPGSRFRRVHVFNLAFGEHIYSSAEALKLKKGA
jgi:hypothetical protein